MTSTGRMSAALLLILLSSWPRGILAMGGFDIHYLFYGADDRLVGFSRHLAMD